jgi:hypothetical protein
VTGWVLVAVTLVAVVPGDHLARVEHLLALALGAVVGLRMAPATPADRV